MKNTMDKVNMEQLLNKTLITLLLFLFAAATCGAQTDKRKAVLRTEQTAAGEEHYIEITTDVQLRQDIYDALKANPQAGPNIGGLFTKGSPLVGGDLTPTSLNLPRNKIIVSPEDNPATPTRKQFRIYFPRDVNPYVDFDDQEYLIDLFNFTDGNGVSAPRIINVQMALERDVRTNDITCEGDHQIAFFYTYDKKNDATQTRLLELYDWFAARKNNQAELSRLKIEAEQLNRKGTKELKVRSLALSPNRERAVDRVRFHVCFETDGAIPSSKFDSRITYNGQAFSELFQPSVIPGLEGEPVEKSPDVFSDESDKSPGERPLDKNLNVATSLTSSVEDVEKEDEQKNKVTVRQRTTRATLDLRLVPKFIYRYDVKVEGSGASYKEWMPIFLDSKVSTGKVNKDTLSLNTVVIGTKGEYRYFPSLGRYKSYYRFIGGLLNASDRDFKQAEFKGMFEFRPVFGFINHPLVSQETTEKKILNPGDKRPLKIIPKNYAFEVLPFIGVEIGRTYLRRRPGEGIEPTDPVRRLYLGLDMVLNPVRFMTFKISDTFYVRSKAESPTDRFRNYFNSSVDFPLGEPTRTPHAIFFSFERGDQPPFKKLGVNALKFGYRLRVDWGNLFR